MGAENAPSLDEIGKEECWDAIKSEFESYEEFEEWWQEIMQDKEAGRYDTPLQ